MRLREALREADEAFQRTPLPPAVLGRLRTRVLAGPGASCRWLVGMAMAAAVVLAIVGLSLVRAGPVQREDVALARGQAWQPAAPRDIAALAKTDAAVHRDVERIRVRSGSLAFSVGKRQPGEAPVRIEVSGGVIEVLGTRFTVTQNAADGEVALEEGSIRFTYAGGETALVAPGETLRWPKPVPTEAGTLPEVADVLAPEPTAPPRKSVRRPERRTEPAVIHETDAAWLLSEVELARSRRDYGEAVRLLEKGLDGLVSKPTRERFSYELGGILTWQQADSARACRHWVAHREAFGTGRYEREVKRAVEHSRCE